MATPRKPKTTPAGESAILLISCADAPGIVAAVTRFISEHAGNILELDEHVDRECSTFLMRVDWDLAKFTVSRAGIGAAFQPIADRFKMQWSLKFSSAVPRMAIFASRQPHCLFDLLARHQAAEWRVEVPLVVSNHEDVRAIADKFGIPFRRFDITAANKAKQEQSQLALLEREKVDFIVLARYMQILTPAFMRRYANRIINIHHSFLPAFPGARPYHSAYQRGVKIIGATSHYVTAELDAGPIIEQDITRVSHNDSVEDFIRKGRDLEKVVLARAVWFHLQHRILVYNNKTVIFV